jgi:methylisocitrate lyase
LVDTDTGWGGAFNISRMIKSMISSRAAGIHIEDQVDQKRCGHRPNKELVSSEEMQDRIKAATDSRDDESFLIMARTDSIANEGIDLALERATSYTEAGADAVFVEAVSDLQQYKIFSDSLEVPILANITEFGLTPLFSVEDLKKVGVDIVLYPLSAFRSMSKAAEEVYKEIIEKGTQEGLIDKMQTREELYKVINYHDFEKKLDELFKK